MKNIPEVMKFSKGNPPEKFPWYNRQSRKRKENDKTGKEFRIIR